MKARCFIFCCLIAWQFNVGAQSLPTNNGGADAEVSFDYKNIAPGVPENSSLGAYGNIPLNTSSGLPNINFNLYTVAEDGVSVPISISYLASGIKFNDIPSCVGLKWTLDCGGSVNRSINGFADESYLYANMNRISDSAVATYAVYNTSAMQQELKEVALNIWDFSLDNYYYSLPSGRQGEMYFTANGNGQFVPYRDYTRLKIQVLDSNFSGFKITDENGVQYFFQGGGDYSKVFKNGVFDKQSNSSAYGLTAWKISKIITPNKRVISFQYQNYSYNYWSVDGQKYTYYTTSPSATCNCGTDEGEDITSEYTNMVSLLTKVYTDDEEVDFNYTNNSNLQIWQMELSNIKVVSKVTQDTVKQISFNYNSSGILELQSFSQIDPTGQYAPVTTSFNYHGTTGTPYASNPETGSYTCGSYARDYYGYFNNASNSDLFACSSLTSAFHYPLTLANRSISPSAIAQGILTNINYPTGGATFFTYEPNADTLGGVVYYAPGVRVKEVKDMQGSSVLHDKVYTYSGLTGGISAINLSCYPYTTLSAASDYGCQSELFFSEFNPALTSGGYYYAKTTTAEVSSTGNIYTRDYYLPDNNLYGVLRGLLSRTEYYKNDTSVLVKAMNYVYTDQVIDSERTSSYVLAPVSIVSGPYYLDNIQHDMCGTTIYQGVNQQYNLRPQIMNMIRESTVTYGATGSDSVAAVKNYHYYINPDLLQSVESTNSNGRPDSTIYMYPGNFSGNAILTAMVDSNMIGLTVEQDYYKNQVLLKKKSTDYQRWDNKFYMPDFESIIDVPTGNAQHLNYYAYDSFANPLEIGKDADMHTAYIWDYVHNYPVAKVLNAASTDVAYTSFEADGMGSWTVPDTTRVLVPALSGAKGYRLTGSNALVRTGLSASKTYIVSYWEDSLVNTFTVNGAVGVIKTQRGPWCLYEVPVTGVTSVTLTGHGIIDEVRLFPKGAMMTTYTYTPLVGMTGTCDPSGKTEFYTYDALRRLRTVKNQYLEIVKMYDYEYQAPNN